MGSYFLGTQYSCEEESDISVYFGQWTIESNDRFPCALIIEKIYIRKKIRFTALSRRDIRYVQEVLTQYILYFAIQNWSKLLGHIVWLPSRSANYIISTRK